MDVPWHRYWRSRPARSARPEWLRGGWILLVIASWVFAALVLFSASAPAQDVDAVTTRLALTLEEPSAPVKESPAAVSQATVGDVQLARTYDGPPTEETTDGTTRNGKCPNCISSLGWNSDSCASGTSPPRPILSVDFDPYKIAPVFLVVYAASKE